MWYNIVPENTSYTPLRWSGNLKQDILFMQLCIVQYSCIIKHIRTALQTSHLRTLIEVVGE